MKRFIKNIIHRVPKKVWWFLDDLGEAVCIALFQTMSVIILICLAALFIAICIGLVIFLVHLSEQSVILAILAAIAMVFWWFLSKELWEKLVSR